MASLVLQLGTSESTPHSSKQSYPPRKIAIHLYDYQYLKYDNELLSNVYLLIQSDWAAKHNADFINLHGKYVL